MDAFFAAVEERDNPRWRGQPIVVGADPIGGRGRGVVATANYQARKYGIHSAMPISRAWQLSEAAKKRGEPAAIFLPGNYQRYEEISRRIFAILRKCSSLIEGAGIDEAYFDLSFAESYKKAQKICRQIKKEIKKKERLTASVGIGPNKLIAKIASDQKKPDGLTVITEREAEEFLAGLPIRKIPGIGPKTEALFKKQEVQMVRDLKKFSAVQLQEMLGKWGTELYQKIRGIDESLLQEEYEVKSIGEQETFTEDTREAVFIFGRLKILCQNVFERFRRGDFKNFKTVAIVVRFADFETKTRAHTLKESANSLKTLENEAIKLLLPFLDSRANPRRKSIRLIGVRLEKLSCRLYS